MHSRKPPPAYPEQFTIALFGKRVQLKKLIGNMILGSEDSFVNTSNNFAIEKNKSFKVINTPDFLDEECPHPDQDIIDFMAMSYPGPNLFILAISSENTQEENVVAQISNLQHTFGEDITSHLVVMLPGIESLHSLSHLKNRFNTRLSTANENLANDCEKWCAGHQLFQYNYKNYSQDVVMTRRRALEKKERHNGHPPHSSYSHSSTGSDLRVRSQETSQHTFAEPEPLGCHDNSDKEEPDNIFNIVLLGLTGTGKSASANTILAAENSELESSQRFKSEPSSMPVTTQCEVKMMEKLFRVQVRVVDTPDFFHDELQNSQAQLEECKRYCQKGKCVVLLVLQLGRFTDIEKEIMEKLENKLGWRIRESTIVLLTHGEDLKGSPEKYIQGSPNLKKIVEQCSHRYHLFNNSSKDTKQVIELIKKFPDSKDIFPKKFTKKFTKKYSPSQCCVC